ncbi:methyl-accepting chemotaxis protein [uncultured Desulfobacter sp.]|uniref:methyl-accepting chemotaxis protein n=1 Tax=uncultured Desulfobacter sp. TaxID=240139 RepID=UPI002AAC0AB6|nr:methyl-accepting chemotaxis protein [uncultured Desulfobacter sp.]
MKLSLRSKLIIGGVLSSIVPIIIVGYFAVDRSTKALAKCAEDRAIQVSKDLANLAEEIVDQEKAFALSIAKAPVVTVAASTVLNSGVGAAKSELSALNKFLHDVFSNQDGKYEDLLVADQNGDVIANGNKSSLIKDVGDRDYFRKAKQGQPTLSEPVLSKGSGRPVIVFAAPLYTPAGQNCGALVNVISLRSLSDTITSVKIGKTGYPFMIDHKGLFIAHPDPSTIFKINATQLDGMKSFAKKMVNQESGVDSYTFRGVFKIAGFAPVKSTGWSISVTQEADDFLEATRAIRNVILMVGVVFLVLVVAGIIWFVKGIMLQLGGEPADLAFIADCIADGNLNITYKKKKDEKSTGIFASMQKMHASLLEMISEVSDGISTLTNSSTELSSISDQMTIGAENASSKANAVAAASEEMTANMNGVAAATEETSANIQMIVAAAEEMSSTISEIAANTAKGSQTTLDAVKKAEEVSKKVNNLGQAASQISKVTEAIADISEQTNLLALNATIEAARAGDAGKGFAVVAGEIKALAHQTAEATSEIGARISEVQATTQDSVSAIESIVKVINEINLVVTSVAAAIEEQSATTQEIVHNVSQAGQGVQEVNENVNQASTVAASVSQEIQQVNEASEEIKHGTIQVNTSAAELSKLAETLNLMISKFTVS